MKKYSISMDKIREICEYNSLLDTVQSMRELKDFFSQKSVKGLYLKDILQEVGLEIKEIPSSKEEKMKWLMENVKISEFDEIDSSKGTEEKTNKEKANKEKGTDSVIDNSSDRKSDSEEPKPMVKISLETVSEFLNSVSPSCFEDAGEKIDVKPVDVYENTPIEYQDEFLIRYKENIYERLVVLRKKNNKKVVGIGSLQQNHILISREHLLYQEFKDNKKYEIILFEKNVASMFEKGEIKPSDGLEFKGRIWIKECNMDYKPMAVSNNTLCIDFGTSNTSAGTYGIRNKEDNEIELVSFIDVTDSEMNEVKLYPTIVYVENCEDKSNIKYLFGYEAKKIVIDKEYDTEASVFFEIKRWIGSLEEEEEIQDELGNVAIVKRKDIIRAYILHIIDLCQQYFKIKFEKLHLSAPVKLKEKFYMEMKSLLYEYIILKPESSVDEGIAIIYNSISNLKGQISSDNTSIMILDCGGGTTDLASCEVSYKELATGTKLSVKTKFVNGNSNFGGNNITFRIMQLLKIKLAHKYKDTDMGDCDVKTLIPYDEAGILNEIECYYAGSRERQYNSDVQNNIYDKFVEAYNKAEDVIPTIFVDNAKFKYAGELKKIKRNYYYLWQLAEKIKIKFYEEDVVSVDFENREDKKLEFDNPENYYIYRRDDNGELLKEIQPAEDIEITINEVRRVLCGDIYGLLNELLSENDLKIDMYKFYKLSGQSCKINLFMELLKEFIPGKRLRTNKAAKGSDEDGENKGSIKLKLDCIKGSIAYIRDKECGKIKPEMETDKPKLIYDVYIKEVKPEMQVLSMKEENKLGYQTFSRQATKALFFVKNSFGDKERKFEIELSEKNRKEDKEDFIQIPLEDLFDEVKTASVLEDHVIDGLKNRIADINPKETDEEDFVRIVFAIPSKEGYGINIYRIVKQMKEDKEAYGRLPVLYENYENESTKSFFDGRR